MNSREREGGLSNLIDIAGAGDGLAVSCDALGQEGGGGKAFTELAIFGAPGTGGGALAGDFYQRGTIGGIECYAAVIRA